MSSFPLVSSELTTTAAEPPAGGDTIASTSTSTAAGGCGDGASSSEAGGGVGGIASATKGLPNEVRTCVEDEKAERSEQGNRATIKTAEARVGMCLVYSGYGLLLRG